MSTVSSLQHLDHVQASDQDLLGAVAREDRSAFEALYKRYHRPIAGYLRRFIQRPELVEEVVDDVMLAVWDGAGRFEGRSQISTWIFGIAYRKAMKAVNREQRQPEPSEEDGVKTAMSTGGMRNRELRLSLDKALAHLSPEHRKVLELTYYQDCSVQEIAKIVHCPVNTVKTRMFHARKRLREILPRLGMQGHLAYPTWRALFADGTSMAQPAP